MRFCYCTRKWFAMFLIAALGIGTMSSISPAAGKDFFVVIGGGFSRESNQASLEANLLFVQEVFAERCSPESKQFYFFADGNDSYEDLQIVAPKPTPTHELVEVLKGIHRQDLDEVAYRNHAVPRVDGRSSPTNVKECLKKIAAEAASGDRIVVYVTAHGGAGSRKSPHNTTVMGWDRSSFSVSDFTEWLRDTPSEVSCISIMAQCYCGGFADSIFDEGNEKNGLTKRLQAGFFAQQHNLPAAGCRPDIENDEEFSSYFWGAMVGRSRTGEPFHGVDLNKDGKVSFAEAYAFTVITSRTIDIPLRASDRLLRIYSNLDVNLATFDITDSSLESNRSESETDSGLVNSRDTTSPPKNETKKGAAKLSGSIDDLLVEVNPTTRCIALALLKQLNVPEDSDLSDVYRLQDELNSKERTPGPRGRNRSRSGRRQLLSLIGSKWELLADRDQWQNHVATLPAEECDSILNDIRNLEGFGEYLKNREETQARIEKSQAMELQQVAFKRLIHHLELAALEKNLSSCASVEIQTRYREMIELENQSL